MSLRLVAFSAMFADDARKIVRPLVAARKLRDSFGSSWINIQGFGQYVTPFGNRDLQLNKLIRDIEDGRVFLLDDSGGFGTVTGCIGSSDSFCSKVNAVKSSARQRPMSGVGYEGSEDSFKVDEYTPEPIVPDEPAEQQERTEFLCGWSECQKGQSKAEVIAALLPSKYQQDKRSFIDRHNIHLGNYVREGEIVVLATREAKTNEELAELNELKAEAQKVSTALHSVSEEEAQAAVRYYPLLDAIGTRDYYSKKLTVGGSVVAGGKAILESIQEDLLAINQLFVDNVLSIDAGECLPKAFYAKRAASYAKVDSSLHKLIFKCVGIKQYKKLKHTLGISMKKMVHHGKDLLDADGVLKGFGSRIEAIVNWIRKADWLGKAGLALDVICSVPVIEEAFTSEEGDPVKAISAEAARVYGGYLGGNIGYKLGPAIVTAGLGLLAGSSVVGAGIAASPIVVGVGVVVGAVGGAWVGATFLSTVLEEVVTTIYDSRELLSEEGGFFDWNVEQP